MLLSQLLRAPVGSRLVRADLDGNTLSLAIATTTSHSTCPSCRQESWRIHSRYSRKLAEEPIFGHQVRLQITVRRFFCLDELCPRRIFVEPLDRFATRYARTTTRLARAHLAIGLALGGQGGARLADQLAVPTSPDTLLRCVKRAETRSSPPPRFVGIDDWAWRKGQRYGTIVVDLETSEVIDLLPDRDAATVKVWLAAHPGIELVSRDRASSYSQAATESASRAQQVADRWHLLKNAREAIDRLLERHLPIITETLKPSETDPGKGVASADDEPSPCLKTVAEETSNSPRKVAAQSRRQRRIERFQKVQDLHRQGTPIRQIARDLALSRRTVRQYLARVEYPEWRRRRRRSNMDEHRPWLDAKIAEGNINVAQLRRELAARGVLLSYATVRRSLTERLGQSGKSRLRVNAAKPRPNRPPSPRQLSFEWIRRPETRTIEAQARLDKIRAASPDLTAALDLADEFKSLIRKRSIGTLQDWLTRAEASPCPEIRHFAEGIRRDESAVNAAITLAWRNGPVEGHVNRLKLIKRQMFGRAGFALLKARVINAA